MAASEVANLPVEMDDRGSYVVWDLCDWDGDIETMDRINEAWLSVHEPPEKTGTISVFPDHVVVDGDVQDYISDGWNEAGEAAGLEHLAIVGDGLQAMAVKNHMDRDRFDVGVFEEVDEAVAWMERQVDG